MYKLSIILFYIFVTSVDSFPRKAKTIQCGENNQIKILAKFVSDRYFDKLSEAEDKVKELIIKLGKNASFFNGQTTGFVKRDHLIEEDHMIFREIFECFCSIPRRSKRDEGDATSDKGSKKFAMILIKSAGRGYRIGVNVLASFIGLTVGATAGLVGGVAGTLFGCATACAGCCLDMEGHMAPANAAFYCANTGYTAGMYGGTIVVEMGLTAGNPMTDFKTIGEKFEKAAL